MAIYKRESKSGVRYRVIIDVKQPDGSFKALSVGTYSGKREAEKAEREALTERDRGSVLEPTKASVADVLTAWLKTKAGEISANALRDYEIVCRLHLVPAFGALKLRQLTAARIQDQYTAWRDGGMSTRQIRGCHLRLSAALDYAVRMKLLSTNPARDCRPPKITRATVAVWSPEEASRFLAVARADTLSPVWDLLLIEGLRRGEALGLRWQDLDLAKRTATITQTVTNDKASRGQTIIQKRTKTASSARTVTLASSTVEVLKAHRVAGLERRVAASEWTDHDLIICTGKGTPISPANLTRSFETLTREAGVPRIRVHDLRHTSASLGLRAGADLKSISDRLGHRSIGITADLYAHLSEQARRDTADAVANMVESAAK